MEMSDCYGKMGNIKIVGRRALVGYSGFLGQTIDKAGRFTDRYNSKTIDLISGSYDRIVCTAPGGYKWKANANPAKDGQSVGRLVDQLNHIDADRFILVSTIDVARNHPYGYHRKYLEEAVRERFPHAAILRLPALFGLGLKKNFLFDLLNGKVPPGGSFHWYPTSRLWDDVVDAHPGTTKALISEAVSMQEIADLWFDGVALAPGSEDYNYNLPGPYVLSHSEVIAYLGTFISQWKSIHAT